MVDHRAISLQILVASDRSRQIPHLSQISSLGLAYQATTKYSSKSTMISTSAGPQKGFHAFYALKFSTQHLTMYAGFDGACDNYSFSKACLGGNRTFLTFAVVCARSGRLLRSEQ